MFILMYLNLVSGLVSHIAGNVTLSKRQIDQELERRKFHEEIPLIYMAEDHPLEFYWLKPYYPSRM